MENLIHVMLAVLIKILGFFFFRAAPTAYGSSQSRDPVGAAVAGHSHRNVGSEPNLQPTPQLTAKPDP